MTEQPTAAHLVVSGAELVATVDAERREILGGWVAITDGVVSGIGGPADRQPEARQLLNAEGCLVTPG
ncbi:MAG: 8-oxoguanine deaminase, partial [Actinomycetota bacterium]|nr:8-oxoguanine deaminase [Actinomycetota bacterium]